MRNLIYKCTKGKAVQIYTKSFSKMNELENDGYTIEVEFEDVIEEFDPTDKRKEWIKNRG